MHLQYSFLALISIICGAGASGFDEIPLLTAATARCDCTGTNDTGKVGTSYICRDPRLGPKRLPRRFPLLSFVSDYDRFGGETPGVFLSQWTTPDGFYKYPPQDGFQLTVAGQPILGNMTLLPGTKVDRFGSEYGMPIALPQQFDSLAKYWVGIVGSYVSAADAPYSQRALPPSNLDTPVDTPDYPYNYHIYTVIKPLQCVGGPIAPWFGQPGLGAQFYVGGTGNIISLLANGYLERVNKTALEAGPGKGGDCGL